VADLHAPAREASEASEGQRLKEIEERLARIEQRLDDNREARVEETLDARLARIEELLDKSLERMEQRIDERLARIEQRLDKRHGILRRSGSGN